MLPERLDRRPEEELSSLHEPRTIAAVRMQRREIERVALANLLRRPRFGRKLELLGLLEIWVSCVAIQSA